MTQLDLPQISLARYIDLLKRRKWQVVPVSLLGMLVGAVIGASVPRYYVASTDVHFNAEHLLGLSAKGLVDPLEEQLDNARTLIPAQVPEVLKLMDWPEAHVDDEGERADYIADVTSRVSIVDIGNNRRNRQYTNLRIIYRDTDGQRAAEFTNALRDRWIKKERTDLEAVVDADVQRMRDRQAEFQAQVDDLARELAAFEAMHKLDPAMRGTNQQLVDRSLQARLQEDRDRLTDEQLELGRLDGEIEGLRQRLEGDIPPLVAAPPPLPDPVVALELTQLRLQLLSYSRMLALFQPDTERHAFLSKKVADLLEEIKVKTPVPTQTLVPNEKYLAMRQQLTSLEKQRRLSQARLDQLRESIAATEAELSARPPIVQEYDEKVRQLAKANNRMYEAAAQLDAATAHALQMRASRPYEILREATVPRRPTEPNVVILALLGSLLGLGVAVGLIFALDAMRFTFKTLDELERGLPVPLLGGVSHVETYFERSQVRRGRLLVSGFAFLLLFLIVAVSTIYYVAPARLPVWARDILDLVLGGTE